MVISQERLSTQRHDHLHEKIENFELTDLEESVIKSASFQHKVLARDAWSTGCGTCKRAFPELQRVTNTDKSHPEVAGLAINNGRGDDSLGKVKRFVEKYNYRVPIVYDPGWKISDRFEIKQLPTWFIIDKTGRFRSKHLGYLKRLENHETVLTHHMNESFVMKNFIKSRNFISCVNRYLLFKFSMSQRTGSKEPLADIDDLSPVLNPAPGRTEINAPPTGGLCFMYSFHAAGNFRGTGP